MFNAVSNERLREIISEKFPTLEDFSDLIYDGPGETFVKLEDGSWTVITVNEGFSQGCHASPTFAAIVLNDILTNKDKPMETKETMATEPSPLSSLMLMTQTYSCIMMTSSIS